MSVLRSYIFFTFVVLSSVFFGLAVIFIAFITKDSDRCHLLARWWGKANLLAGGVAVDLVGAENINPQDTYVFAANHQSWFDIFALLGMLPVQFRWIAKKELFTLPYVGPAMKAAGYIPIERGKRRQAYESLNKAADRIRNGTSVVMFPEGTRSSDGVLREFKKGTFLLALKSGRPIVPISISGSWKLLPKGTRSLHPGRIRVTISRPLPTDALSNRNIQELMIRVREAIRMNLSPEEAGYQIQANGQQDARSV